MAFLFVLLILFFISWFLIRLLYIPKSRYISLYFGDIGSGKSTFLTRQAVSLAKKGIPVFTNFYIGFDGIYQLNKSYLGSFSFPPGSFLAYDEGSLNGFDSRDYATNFKGNNSLEYFKLIRHFENRIMFGNQGYHELDNKIRDLTADLWQVKPYGPFSVAVRIYRTNDLKKEEEDIVECYRHANLFRLLFWPREVQIIYRPRYYQYFDSFEHPDWPPSPEYPWKNNGNNADDIDTSFYDSL